MPDTKTDTREGIVRRYLAVALLVATWCTGGYLILVQWTDGIDTDVEFVFPVLFGSLVGAFLSFKVPSNRIGLLLCVVTACIVALGASDVLGEQAYQSEDLDLAAALNAVNAVASVTFLLSTFVLLPLWLPTGKPPSPKWAFVSWAAIIATALTPLSLLTSDTACVRWNEDDCLVESANPFQLVGVDLSWLGIAFVIPLVAAGFAALSMFVRWRSAGVAERAQLKWPALATVLLVVSFLITGPLGMDAEQAGFVVALALTFLFLAIAISVTRYRLFEIDRIISRTVGYAIVVVLLGGIYVAGAVWLPTRLIGDAVPPVFVATSTLLVIALFNPVRRRVLDRVDRLFYRARYDAQQVVEQFGDRLRDEVDSDVITAGLLEVVNETMQPDLAGVWVKE